MSDVMSGGIDSGSGKAAEPSPQQTWPADDGQDAGCDVTSGWIRMARPTGMVDFREGLPPREREVVDCLGTGVARRLAVIETQGLVRVLEIAGGAPSHGSYR